MIKRVVLVLSLLIGIVAVGAGVIAWLAWKQQTALLITTANQLLRPYGIEVLSVQGLTTGFQSSYADQVKFRSTRVEGEHNIRGLRLEYDPRLLIQGQIQRLQAQSVELNPQHSWLRESPVIRFQNLDILCSTLQQCNGSIDFEAKIAHLQIPEAELQAKQLNLETRFDISYEAPVIRIELAPGVKAALGDLETPELKLEQLSLDSQQAWRLNINLEEQLLVADGGQLSVHVPVLRQMPPTADAPGGLSGFELALDRINASYDFKAELGSTKNWQQRLSAQAAFTVEKIYTTLIPFNLWSWHWQQQLEWSPSNMLQLTSTGSLGESNILDIGIRQNFANGDGHVQVQTNNLNFDPGNLTLADVLSPLPVDADLIAGDLHAQATFDWKLPESKTSFELQQWQLRGNLVTEATELAGFYEDTAFAGFNTVARWQLQPDLTLHHQGTSELRLAELNPGIQIHNLQTRYHYDTMGKQLNLQDSQLTLFDGLVTAEPFVLDFSTSPAAGSEFNVQIDGIDISEVLSLAAYNQINASGLIDGNLPVSLTGLTPVITGGILQARAPGGSIRYNAGQGPSGNQSLDLVYQALAHYQYESLQTTVDYAESGELQLGMQLQGLSPELNNGQRINLNLNISDDIPALLQSLQAAQNVSDRLEDLLNH